MQKCGDGKTQIYTYMGHTNFSDTAYYIHLLPENLIRSSAIDWAHFSDLIPEVDGDE